jgi:hypothetical protein
MTGINIFWNGTNNNFRIRRIDYLSTHHTLYFDFDIFRNNKFWRGYGFTKSGEELDKFIQNWKDDTQVYLMLCEELGVKPPKDLNDNKNKNTTFKMQVENVIITEEEKKLKSLEEKKEEINKEIETIQIKLSESSKDDENTKDDSIIGEDNARP